MIKSLMRGLSEANMQAVVNTYNLNPYYYPSFFPLKATPMLQWKTLEAQAGLKVAADVVSFNSSIPKKTRDAVARLDGDIPKISISREKNEDELNEYNMLLALSTGNQANTDLVNFWAEDTAFCWEGVAARLEWIALKQISLGKVTFSTGNNAAVVTKYNVDYQIPAAQKIGFQTGSASWDTPASAKPITKDFVGAVKLGRAAGLNPKIAWMSIDTFVKFASTDEVVKLTSSLVQNALSIPVTPDLASVNAALARQANLYGLQIRVIDQLITIEQADGTRTSDNPFETDVVTFTESEVLGQTFHAPLADERVEGSVAMKVKRGHTLIKKYAVEEPIAEVTMGMANAFPAWSGSGRSILMQTNSSTWTK